jgi:hypothetical protein
MKTVDLELARQLLNYDPETGVFTWTQQDAARAGKRAGVEREDGAFVLTFAGHTVYAHRLAFALVHGEWPRWVAHLDGNMGNNRISNLRAGTFHQRGMTRKKTRNATTSRFKGVHWSSQSKKWIAHIGVNGRRVYLGIFANEEAAGAAYASAAKQVAGEFARVVT